MLRAPLRPILKKAAITSGFFFVLNSFQKQLTKRQEILRVESPTAKDIEPIQRGIVEYGLSETKQYKSLDDLKAIISELEGFIARPVIRGNHPAMYSNVSEGDFRTVLV